MKCHFVNGGGIKCSTDNNVQYSTMIVHMCDNHKKLNDKRSIFQQATEKFMPIKNINKYIEKFIATNLAIKNEIIPEAVDLYYFINYNKLE